MINLLHINLIEAMSFLKIKRKCEEDPKEVFVLASKKCKLHDSYAEVPIFELTSPSVKENDIEDVISKTLRNNYVKSHKFDIEKIRKQMRDDNSKHAKSSRYRMLNVLRKVNENEPNQCVPVIGVVDGTEKDENDSRYVYDLYFCSTNINVNETDFDENYYLHEIKNEWDTDYDIEDDEPVEDEDDSNDENNWRNDYPDEGEDSDGNSDQTLSKQFRRTRLSSTNSLSSDAYDEEVNDSVYDKNHKNKKYFDYYDEIASDTSEEY